jgi:hypothetical protein
MLLSYPFLILEERLSFDHHRLILRLSHSRAQIVSHMSRSQLTLHHLASPGVLVLAAAAFNIYCPVLGLGATSPVTHETMLIVCAIASLSSFLYFTAGTVNDLCSHLGIRCFSLKSPRPLKKAS